MLRWAFAVLAVVVTLCSVSADQSASVVSAAEASVAAAIASESPAAVEASSSPAVDTEMAMVEAEADRKKKKESKKKHNKDKKKKPKRRYVGGDILFNRAMNVRGVMAAGSIIANNATVQGTLITRQLKTKRVKAHTMSVGELKTTRLSSPTGTIVIEGDLLITHSRGLEYAPKNASKPVAKKGKGKGKGKGKEKEKAKTDAAVKNAAKGASFLAEEVIVNGVKQWALVRHDHFQTPDTHDGWRLVGTNEAVPTGSCGGSGDAFLGGHCVLANGPARKVYAHLPPHTQLRVTARYHFIDNWRGETAFAQVDNRFVWSQTHRGASGTAGIQMCGNTAYPESRLSSPIDVSVAHTASTVSIAFGAHSAGSASGAVRSLADEKQNACERSFGVDDVSIYIR